MKNTWENLCEDTYKQVWTEAQNFVKYIEKEIQDYNDQILLDYLRFGFPLGINKDKDIKNNATENHTSANQFPQAIEEYIGAEINYGALLGPFDHPPHRNFTWSPLMTRPKGPGRRVILDLSLGTFQSTEPRIRNVMMAPHLLLNCPDLKR